VITVAPPSAGRVLAWVAMFACRRLVPLAFGFLVVGCGGGGDDTGVPIDAGTDAISPTCIEAMTHSDLTWIQDRIFSISCAGANACHKGAAADAAGLSLERGQSHRQTVDIDTKAFPAFKRVVATNPAQSYLMIAVGQYPGPIDPDVGTMPYNNPLLCKEKRDAIERWIVAGALDEF
jgi:hypothetical protein